MDRVVALKLVSGPYPRRPPVASRATGGQWPGLALGDLPEGAVRSHESTNGAVPRGSSAAGQVRVPPCRPKIEYPHTRSLLAALADTSDYLLLKSEETMMKPLRCIESANVALLVVAALATITACGHLDHRDSAAKTTITTTTTIASQPAARIDALLDSFSVAEPANWSANWSEPQLVLNLYAPGSSPDPRLAWNTWA